MADTGALRFPLGAASLFLIAALIVTGWRLLTYAPPPVDPAWELPAADDPGVGPVTVRFSGTTTLLFSDGETSWMTDGWFSRPGLLSVAFGRIKPDTEAVEAGLARNGVRALAAVVPLHSHYDHAMDAPEVARQTGAQLLGSEATANIGRGWGLPESQISMLRDREPLHLGAFTIVPIESRHIPYNSDRLIRELIDDWQITEPLVPPAKALDYKLGKAYVLHVSHPRGSFLVMGSAGFVPGQLAGLDVDVLFLGVGALGSQPPEYREAFWRETALQVQPELIIPIHWDSLLGPTDEPFTGEIRLASLLAGDAAELKAFMLEKAAAHPEMAWHTLPRYRPVVILE